MFKRRRRRRRRFRPKFKTTRSRIFKNKKDIKMLKSQLELKWSDEVVSTLQDITSAAWYSQCLNELAEGTGEGQRCGEKVFGRGIKIRGYFYNAQGTPADAVIRVILFRAKSPNNQTAATIAGFVLQNDKTLNSHYHYQHGHRFKIYYDQTFTMMDGSQSGVHSYLPFKINAKLRSEVGYNGNAGTAADIEKNGLYLIAISNVASATDCPQIAYISRFTYTDA